MLGAWQARYGWRDPAEAVAAAGAVLHCRHEGDGPVRHDLTDLPAMRAGWLLGELAALEVWTGDLGSAADHIYAGTTLAHVLDAPRLTASMLSLRATVEMISGAYQTALATAEECLEVCDLWGLRDTARCRALLARGWARFHAFELDAAERDLALARLYSEDMADPYLLTYTRLLEACALTARGDATAAARVLDAQGVVSAHPPAYVARHTAIIRLLGDAHLGDHASIRAEAGRLDRERLGPRRRAGERDRRRARRPPGGGARHARGGGRPAARRGHAGRGRGGHPGRAAPAGGHPGVARGRARPAYRTCSAGPAGTACCGSCRWAGCCRRASGRCWRARPGPVPTRSSPARPCVAFDREPVAEASEHDLTDRELDVLRQVALGGQQRRHRRGAVHHREHREDPPGGGLPQARRRPPVDGRTGGAGATADLRLPPTAAFIRNG